MKRAAEISTCTLHSDTETVPTNQCSDLSILRKPIKTSMNGLNEARKAYEDGTDEVRKLLSNECDIIYECKLCRNMFRSLANFISHKRIYCKNTYCSSLQYDFHNDGKGFSQDISTIVQAENDFIDTTLKTSKSSEKDLSSIVERLIKREKASRILKLSDFYEQVNNKLTQDELLQQRHVLHLDVVPESNVAVYQTVKNPDDAGDTIKSEVIEINDISDQSRTVLGPDGKVVNPADLPKFPDEDDRIARPFECEICNTKFGTEKMLKLHIETKHIQSTYVFQCPSCSKTFLTVGQVIRHLTNDHKKSMRRVRLMRDSILKRRTRIDEVQVKGPSRELKLLQTDKERVDSQNKAWLDNLEDNENISKNVCLFCGRQFDRKAVLLSHLKVCQLKKKPNTRISLTRKVDHDRPSASTNGWNEREFDDSSNSNSLDGAYVDEKVTSTSKEKSTKPVKIETDIDVTENISTSRRKRNRATRAIVTDEVIHSDDEKSLNICWNADEPSKIKEESVSPVDDVNMSDSGSNNDADTQIKVDKTEDVKDTVKDEKRTRATNGNNATITKNNENKAKPKSSSHCKYCFKKFSNASNLRRHITMSHFGPKKFTCNLCTFRARRKIDILSHMRTKHEFGGERTDALKFVTINNDEPAQKPVASVNRRKEKHTEVLRDDEAEIFIDSEAFVVEESGTEQFAMADSNENSNVDMENTSHSQTTDNTDETNKSNCSKRKGRPKTKDKFKKLIRSLSPVDQKESESLPTRRPVRNRIMPVKKDFVYDLSTLLKKDYKDIHDELQKQPYQQPIQPSSSSSSSSQSPSPQTTQPQMQLQTQPQSEQQSQSQHQPPQVAQVDSQNASPTSVDSKASKRRHTLPDTAKPAENEHQTNDQIKDEIHKLPLQQPSQMDEKSLDQSTNDTGTPIRGAADEMARSAVQLNRATFFKPPELPCERPLATPQRQFDSAMIKDWPILKRPSSLYDGLKSKMPNIKVPGLKRKKRSCLLKHPSNTKTQNLKNRLNDKHQIDTNGHTDNHYKCNELDQPITDTIKISSKLADKIQLQCAQIDGNSTKANIKAESRNTQPLSSVQSQSAATPQAPKAQLDNTGLATPRRMTLLERLAENKTKKLNESLSRMTIANSDNDSDED